MLQVGAGRRKCKEASEIHKFSTVSKTHDNKLTVNLYLVAGPGIPNNQLSVQRPADLLIVVKIKMSHFFSMSQQLSHLCTKFPFPIISTNEFTSKSI